MTYDELFMEGYYDALLETSKATKEKQRKNFPDMYGPRGGTGKVNRHYGSDGFNPNDPGYRAGALRSSRRMNSKITKDKYFRLKSGRVGHIKSAVDERHDGTRREGTNYEVLNTGNHINKGIRAETTRGREKGTSSKFTVMNKTGWE